jgi:vacuolar-type H+-ATPase catalytic subunit A/Vma1
MDILVYELGKLSKTEVKVPAKPSAPPMQPVRQKPPPPPPVLKADPHQRRPNTPEAEELRSKLIGMLKVQSNLQSTLELLKSDKERKAASETILDLDKQIHDIYLILEHYDKHGVLPAKKTKGEQTVKDITSMSADELIKYQYTLKTYLSRYKSKIEKSKTDDERKRNQAYLDKYKRELETVTEKLKAR